jgi:hypothetical protein
MLARRVMILQPAEDADGAFKRRLLRISICLADSEVCPKHRE